MVLTEKLNALACVVGVSATKTRLIWGRERERAYPSTWVCLWIQLMYDLWFMIYDQNSSQMGKQEVEVGAAGPYHSDKHWVYVSQELFELEIELSWKCFIYRGPWPVWCF